jgi:hypothetical protein
MDAYVCRLLPLTCLAPDMWKRSWTGGSPKGSGWPRCWGMGRWVWEEQRMSWGTRVADGAG